ncbi:type IX secretion system outer membrane channel protein PorV [Phaeodactylibacter luteus]|uniref:Type IX secretion system outer membrane channel protein PorV n=1 Tax=Phaeodactylibacter luteus TaxID=1564516 RepID=A0A5C6RH93_9BACT|nr:type IX secretion system outer membrane channel protein PorV [Phaeodactylibacter luteus]TXB61507.1 type IX secretion system outer membrane channel protein PorV [Phaeodactylibacter luteus]
MKKSFLLNFLFTAIALTTVAQQAEAQCTRQDPSDPNSPLINLDGTPCVNTVVSAVPFLRIVADARSGAMGDAGIAISADPNAIHFNASKLVFAEETFAMSATYTPWLQNLGLNDVYLAYLTGFYKLDDLQTLGFGLRYFSLGSIQFTDQNGEPLAIGQPNEFEVSLAYARKLTDNFSASLTGKFIYSNLAAGQQVEGGETIEPGVAGAADVAMTYKTEIDNNRGDAELVVGLALTNIGSRITYTNSLVRDFLPANIGLGAAYTMEFDEYNKLTLTTDINKLMVPTPCQAETCEDLNENNIADYREQSSISGIFASFGDAPDGFQEELRELMYSFGVEYWYDNQFAVRAGYFNEHAQKGGRKYLTVGLGLKYNIFGLNFSYLVPTTNQRNPLDNTLRFSLLFDFGSMGELE